MKNKVNNLVNVIFPYRGKYGIWAFDDEEVGLQGEVFVGNINNILDILTNGAEEAIVYISKNPIPGHNAKLIKTNSLDGQPIPGWYKEEKLNITGYLCPALLYYFSNYPEIIYAKVEGIKDGAN